MLKMKLAAASSFVALFFAGSANAAINVNWVDWTEAGQGSVKGSVTAGSATVGITFSGPYSFAQTNGGTDYWVDLGYTQGLVNRPTGTDLIALDLGGRKSISFSQAVVDPFIAFASWNGNVITFTTPFTFISMGCGYWGCGDFRPDYLDTAAILGNGEVHGVLQFKGTFTQITFTDTSENWHGLTVGVSGAAAPEPATWAMMMTGFGLAGGALRSRRRALALG